MKTSHLGRKIAVAAVATASFAAMVMTPIAVTSPTASAAGQYELHVGSYNIRAGVSTTEFSNAVHGVMEDADVVGLQEVNRHEKEDVLINMRSQGFSYYRAPKDHGEQNPVVWRTSRFQLVSARYAQIAKSWYVGNEIKGRGPRTLPMWASVVHLQDKVTGDNVSVINVHLLPGACINGGPTPGRPQTFKAFRSSVINLEKLAKSEKSFGNVYVMGDFNIGYQADKRVGRTHLPVKSFGRLGMGSMWATELPSDKRGSHVNSPSLIDQVFSAQKASSATAHFEMSYSDHYPVIARYLVG